MDWMPKSIQEAALGKRYDRAAVPQCPGLTHTALRSQESLSTRQKALDSYYHSWSQNLYPTNNNKLHCLKNSQGKLEEDLREEEREGADTVGEEKNSFGFGLSD